MARVYTANSTKASPSQNKAAPSPSSNKGTPTAKPKDEKKTKESGE